jgi:murein DD-endopeptidase MepM/ murein hydrolase activator NlpD
MPHRSRPTPRSRRSAVVTALCVALLAGAWTSAARADARPAGRLATAQPPGHDAARAALAREGRAAARLVADGDARALHARFTRALARRVSQPEVARLLARTRATAPVGARLGESLLPLGGDRRTYVADYRWGDGALGITFAFTARGRIGAVLIRPRDPLPPDPASGAAPSLLRLPVAGTWWVFWGGPSERQNHHAPVPDQRHALDLVQWRDGGTARGRGTRNADYHAWDKRVVAPAAGVVVAARDGVRDNRPQVTIENRADPAGNHVLLDLGAGRHVLLAHLRSSTVAVRPGDRVAAGALLGRVGNSGNSSEPHLHVHVQDGPRLLVGTGLPMAFSGLVVDGRRRERAEPVQGQFIAG